MTKGSISPFGPLGLSHPMGRVPPGEIALRRGPFRCYADWIRPRAATSRQEQRTSEYRYPVRNIPFDIKARREYYYCVVSGPTQWRDWKSSLSSMRMTNLGGWSSVRTVGCGSLASRRGRTTVRVIGGDPIGSRPGSEPDGRAKSSE